MIAVEIDISKSKSKAAIPNGDGTLRAKPFDAHHTKSELDALINYSCLSDRMIKSIPLRQQQFNKLL